MSLFPPAPYLDAELVEIPVREERICEDWKTQRGEVHEKFWWAKGLILTPQKGVRGEFFVGFNNGRSSNII